ncbi:hypothetical protein ANCDUO_05563 [Ancylostoma duodenale]|uniref:Uncharacterized protein n=1 Tax=Ancylostoma duodenale TaxID=51022 RepID=A0A0C2D3S7_9BILA|nr:hypothetical protein ANCDUO_05563 [Ancylostoma duodenale]
MADLKSGIPYSLLYALKEARQWLNLIETCAMHLAGRHQSAAVLAMFSRVSKRMKASKMTHAISLDEFMHNRDALLDLADQTLKQIDSASAPVKTLFQKIFALENDKNNREKERETEIAEIEKVFGKLTENEKKEITTLGENYEKKAQAVGLEDLLLTIKD